MATSASTAASRLTQSLLAAGLVDVLRLLVAPRVAGSGRRLFADDVVHSLELVQSTGSPTGSLLVHYDVVGLRQPIVTSNRRDARTCGPGPR